MILVLWFSTFKPLFLSRVHSMARAFRPAKFKPHLLNPQGLPFKTGPPVLMLFNINCNYFDEMIIQSNLDYPDLDYPDFSIIRTFSLSMNINKL